jgi:hypothetical protein
LMRTLVYLTLVFPLAAAPLARPVALRADPRRATWLLTGAAVGLALSSAAALGLLVVAVAVRLRPIARVAHLSVRLLERVDPTGGSVALVAAALLGLALTASLRFTVRRCRAIGQSFALARRLPGRGQVVVVDAAVAEAYAVPGKPGRIVVSSAMLNAVGFEGRAVVLAHERAHLRGHHWVFIAATSLAAVANPLLRPFVPGVEYSVERWADESAVAEVGDRALVARTVARAALAAKATGASARMPAVLGIAGSRPVRQMLSSSAGPVPRRVAALLSPDLAWGRALLGLLGLLVVGAGFCAVEAARDLHIVFELADKANLHR